MSENPTLHRDGDELTVSVGETVIARYVLRPQVPGVEAPKPYFHPLNTLSGAPLTAFRPWDHRWHKGLQMTWSHVSGQNFWGGPTYVRDSGGYEWLDNVGSIQHQSLDEATEGRGEVSFTERLTWVTARGEDWISEVRTHRVHSVDTGRGLWALDFTTALTNVRGEPLSLGSPTTHGRPAAGYAGLFWRGPRSWTGCQVLTSTGISGGTEAMGTQSEWIALVGQHDEIDGGATVLGFSGTTSGTVPITWFVRSEPFPVLCPSPSFDQTLVLEPTATLVLAHRLVFVDRMCDADEIAELGKGFAL